MCVFRYGFHLSTFVITVNISVKLFSWIMLWWTYVTTYLLYYHLLIEYICVCVCARACGFKLSYSTTAVIFISITDITVMLTGCKWCLFTLSCDLVARYALFPHVQGANSDKPALPTGQVAVSCLIRTRYKQTDLCPGSTACDLAYRVRILVLHVPTPSVLVNSRQRLNEHSAAIFEVNCPPGTS
jgi:hypothetical protein